MTEIKIYGHDHFGELVPMADGYVVYFEDHLAFVAEYKQQLSRYSMSAGQADQRRAESVAVRTALGFGGDADDVSPKDLVDAIAALQEQVRALAAENVALKDAFHPETVPDDLLDNFGDAVKMDGETFWEGDNCKNFSCVSNAEELIKLSLASMGDIETPDTDVVLREIRANVLEDMAEDCDVAWPQTHINVLRDRAARIRSGEQP